MNLFGIEITIIGTQGLETDLYLEDEDKANEVAITLEEIYVDNPDGTAEMRSGGFFAPPPQRWWMR